MEPLTIATTVVGITIACLKVTKILNGLRPKYIDASATIASICSESTLVSASLSQIQTLLLQKSKEMATQLQTRPEIAATIDTTLTGCAIVFACLEEEVTRLELEAWRGEDQQGWLERARLAWKADGMKELLQSIRGQQGAITLLAQMIQMESLSDIQKVLQENTAMLRACVQRTRSLRHSNPRVNASVPESVLGRKDSESVLHIDDTSTIGATEFEFDEVVVNSRAYRRALQSFQKRRSLASPLPASAPSPRADAQPGCVDATPPSGLPLDEGANTTPVAETAPWSLDSTPGEEVQPAALGHSPSLRRSCHVRRKYSSRSGSQSLGSSTEEDEQFWSSIPDLTLDEKLLALPPRLSFDDNKVSSIGTSTTSSIITGADSLSGVSMASSATSCSVASPLHERPNSIHDSPSRQRSRLRAMQKHFEHETAPLPQPQPSTDEQISPSRRLQSFLSHPSDATERVPAARPLIFWARNQVTPPTPSHTNDNQTPDAMPRPKSKPALKKKSVSFQLPGEKTQDIAPTEKTEPIAPIAKPSHPPTPPEDAERSAIQLRFQLERDQFEARRQKWESRRRRASSIDQAICPPAPPRAGKHTRSRPEDLLYSFPPHLPMALKTNGGAGLTRPARLRIVDVPQPQMAHDAIMRASQSVYALNAGAYMPSRQSYQQAWRPMSQARY